MDLPLDTVGDFGFIHFYSYDPDAFQIYIWPTGRDEVWEVRDQHVRLSFDTMDHYWTGVGEWPPTFVDRYGYAIPHVVTEPSSAILMLMGALAIMWGRVR
jgi:hypothetical protein